MKLYPLCEPTMKALFNRQREYDSDCFAVGVICPAYPLEVYGIDPNNTELSGGEIGVRDLLNELKRLHNLKKENQMELKIEKENVLKAAASCSDARRVLKQLFPQAFEDEDNRVDFSKHPLTYEIEEPFFIGKVYARDVNPKDENKVLIADVRYRWEIIHNYYAGMDAVQLRKIV